MQSPHAFISYVKEDKADVDRIQRALEQNGIRTWRDTENLWPGEDWRFQIRKAITNDALVFIACFSDRSIARHASYQNDELLVAIEQLRSRRPDQPWLIPVRLSDCRIPAYDIGMGRTLASLHWVDIFGSDRKRSLNRLVAGVHRIMDSLDQAHADDSSSQPSGQPQQHRIKSSHIVDRRDALDSSEELNDILTERELSVAAGDVLDVVWATSRALGAVLAVKEDLPAVTAVLVGPNRNVTVHLAEPADPAPPFEVGAATDRWVLYLDEVDLVSGPEPAVAVLDTLTALGLTDADEWLFVDLESLGAVELAGDPVVAAELAQSIVTELTLQLALDNLVDLTVIGVDELTPSVAEQGVANAELDQELVRRFEQSADETTGFLDMQNLRSTAAARAKGVARDGLFVTVVAYGGAAPADPVLLERLAAAATPGGRGVAVVAFGPLGAGATRVIVTDDGRAHIPRLGITVTAARLERRDLDRISEILAHESQRAVYLQREVGVAASRREFGPPDYLEPAWSYCVRIFADHMVETPEGEVISFRYGDNPDVPNKNTHRGPELLSYLALSGRAASATDMRNHLWWNRPVALGTTSKLLHGTRKVLGSTRQVSGGGELLSLTQGDPGLYRLSPDVVTDVELLAHALQHAHAIGQMYPDVAIDVLRGHLARLKAVAFRSGHLGQGLAEWARVYRVVDRVEPVVIDAALLFAKLSTDRGPDGYENALWAIDQGLFACPVNEALARAAMEIEARLDGANAVNARYQTLEAKLARDQLVPEPETVLLRSRLVDTKGAGGHNIIR